MNKERHGQSEANRQTNRQKDRDRQADRQANRQRQTEIEKQIGRNIVEIYSLKHLLWSGHLNISLETVQQNLCVAYTDVPLKYYSIQLYTDIQYRRKHKRP